MADEPKFCKDCKHYVQGQPASCSHPELRSLVTGTAFENPMLARRGRCGTAAVFWEERPTAPPPVQFLPGDIVIVGSVYRPRVSEPPDKWWEFWK